MGLAIISLGFLSRIVLFDSFQVFRGCSFIVPNRSDIFILWPHSLFWVFVYNSSNHYLKKICYSNLGFRNFQTFLNHLLFLPHAEEKKGFSKYKTENLLDALHQYFIFCPNLIDSLDTKIGQTYLCHFFDVRCFNCHTNKLYVKWHMWH